MGGPKIIVDLMVRSYLHVFVYIVYVFATIVVHFRLLFNPSIFNISPPPFIPKICQVLTVFFTFLKSHLILITPLYGPSVSFLTPPLPFSKLERKKSTRFFFRPNTRK